MDRLILIVPLIALLLVGTVAVYSQQGGGNQGGGNQGGGNGGGGQQGGGIPKVDIFARQVSDTAILVTWENPSDTADDIQYKYTVSKDVNRTENYIAVFDSRRNLEEKIIDNNGQEMFFYLDEDIKPNTIYEYRVGTGNVQGNPNQRNSDDTKQIFIHPKERMMQIESHAKLIVGRNITPIVPIISWFNWFDMQEVSADSFVNDIFTTTLNPQNEPYRMALEPIPSPANQTHNCDQVLKFQYSKNLAKGQDMKVVASIFEPQIIRDDEPQSYTKTMVLKHQKTFNDFTDSIKVKSKWFAIHPANQTILNFTGLEIQLDVTADPTADPNEFRSLTIWDAVFIVPEGTVC